MRVYCDGSLTKICYIFEGSTPCIIPVTGITHNEAEYLAIISALEASQDKGIEDILLVSDSQLAIKQLNSEYAIKDKKMQRLALIAWRIAQEIGSRGGVVKFEWVPREENLAGKVLG